MRDRVPETHAETAVEPMAPTGPTRRTVLTAGAVVGATLPLLDAVGAGPGVAPAAALDGYDSRQRFVRLVGGGGGVIYAIQADGKLMWYRHAGWQTQAASWVNGGAGRQIGTAWAQFETVLAGGDGTLFAMRSNGDLLWYRYVVTNSSTGAGYWAARSGSVIGVGFDRFPRLLGGYENVIWGIDGIGDLYRYQYNRNDGTIGSGAWSGGNKVGTGWGSVADAVADYGGVIYAATGTLRWYRYVNGKWDPSSGKAIGSGWSGGGQRTMLCAGGGALYRLLLDTTATPNLDDRLIAHRLTNYTSAGPTGPKWHTGTGTIVGSGFTYSRTAALQGYENTLAVKAGGTAAFAVSTSFSQVQASVVRLAPGAEPTIVRNPVTVPGGIRVLPGDYRSAGCRWPTSLTIDVPADWQSGLYALRLEGQGGLRRHIPFSVRPALPSSSIAVLMPTFTYLAYNSWSGHNQYTVGEDGRRRTMSMFIPEHSFPVAPTGRIDHTWWSDQILLRWMSREGFAYDVYEDQDLHLSKDWLMNYQTLVLPTHPEYWTESMRTNLLEWLGTGGRLIYTGGNGLYERVVYDPAAQTVRFRRADGARDVYREAGLPESQILGIAYDSRTYGSFAPFQVTRDHPLYAGTGLEVGATFGVSGYSGAASGWESDGRLGFDGDARPEEVIAEGLHASRSHMVFMERPNGGFVFSAGSLTFNGALDRDPRLSALLRNVFTRALTPNEQQLETVPPETTPDVVPPVEETGREGAVIPAP